MPRSKAIDDFADGVARRSGRLGDQAQAAVKTLPDVAERARKAVDDGVEQLRQVDLGELNERFDDARGYVVDRVQDRPVAATAVALAVGFLIGMMFAGNRR